MIRLSQERTKSLLAIHGWAGVALGLLLYAVILTGVVAVFADEIGEWANPTPQALKAPFPSHLDDKLRELAPTVDPKYHEEVSLFPRAAGQVQVFFHRHVTPEGESQPQEEGVEFILDPVSLEVVSRHEGLHDDIQAFDVVNALSDFLVELHVSLHIPDPWGFFVTGILGLTMMVAAVTGLFMHRHLLKELFTIRRLREALLARRDTHVVAATWNLPFAFVLAFTGSFYSFSGSVGIPLMAMVAFGGDQKALIETIIGIPPAEDKKPAMIGDLDGMFADARTRVQSEPVFAGVSHYGRADSQVTIFTRPADSELFNHNLVYAASDGRFLREKPSLGLVPSVGGTAADLMGPLHFGNFAGVLSKSAWFALGFASCYVALSGVLLWTTRRAQQPGWRHLERAANWMGFGLPLALTAVPYGYFVGRVSGAPEIEPPMAIAFLTTAAIALVVTVLLRTPRQVGRCLLLLTGVALLGLPVLRMMAGGAAWTTALATAQLPVVTGDLVLLIGGLACITAARRSVRIVTEETGANDAARETEVTA